MLALLVFAVALNLIPEGTPLAGPVVNTPNGPILGAIVGNSQQFRGIPYGVPPVGSLRFMPPVSPSPWGPQVLNATEFGFGCAQSCGLPEILCPARTSEDCLNLNVWTPLGKPSNLPVLVFIYGGAFVQGTALTSVYDPLVFVENGIIAVTFEYRLGALGFLYNGIGVQGNQGILDQQAVLEWVRDSIEPFGGDPSRVTIWGESAGAMSVALHLSISVGLFSSAILNSDPLPIETPTTTQNVQRAEEFALLLNCDALDVECLQSKAVEEILDASDSVFVIPTIDTLVHDIFEAFLPWQPTIDGYVIVENPFTLILQDNWAHVPVMIGSNTNEGIEFVYGAVSNLTSGEYLLAVIGLFKGNASSVLRYYPVPDETDCRANLSNLVTDYTFACPSRYLAQAATQQGVQAYVYHFNEVTPGEAPFWNNFPACVNAVCHGAELPYCFDSFGLSNITITAPQQNLAMQMSTYWSNFVLSGNPNKPLPVTVEWPLFNNSNIAFQVPIGTESYLEKNCNFLNTVGYFH
jgi:carboxylesterase type B